MDDSTLNSLAQVLAPKIIEVIKGKGKKDVTAVTQVSEEQLKYVYSLPCHLYNEQTGEKQTVKIGIKLLADGVKEAATIKLTETEAKASEAAAAAEESKRSAAQSAASAKESANYALDQKNATTDYLNEVKANEEARKTNENTRISQENARMSKETTRVSQENTRIYNEEKRKEAESARVTAETARIDEFNSIKSSSQAATKAANDATTKANTSANNADKQTALCKRATDLATELNEHPLKYGHNGNWWKWNVETDEYEDTGIIAKGGGMYPMVRSRRNHVIWFDSAESFKDRIIRRRNHTVIKF